LEVTEDDTPTDLLLSVSLPVTAGQIFCCCHYHCPHYDYHHYPSSDSNICSTEMICPPQSATSLIEEHEPVHSHSWLQMPADIYKHIEEPSSYNKTN